MISLALTAALALQSASEPVTLPASPAPLHGTLLAPEHPRAVAVILPGSGPTDRDGNSAPFNIRARSLALLAEALSEEGVATIRIDKRGVGESAAAGVREEELRFDMLAVDARAWAAEAAARTGQPCAWLIGHSEGALVALDAARQDEAICGLVLISGAGRPAADAIRDQLRPQLPPAMMADAERALSDLEAGRTTASVPGLEMLLRPSVQPYLISWFALDPAGLAAAYEGPVLIVSGSNDLQIPPAEADALQARQPRARRLDVDGMNHVMKIAPTGTAENLATYANPSLPLAPRLATTIVEVIQKPDGR
ncbi:alpha/beta hydrolase [Brevundimonas sp. WCHBH090558]|uniref:alpha/beta hydrolase n=1 Tax=Brevundimonas huaxiensis TaxID=2725493 RepID=UPI0016243967|nr:alpha/beta fold hydrolase [Brevundimonas huaxiensis]MBC1181907.1 alpha/beta hydrolase [Brevundimonas huaxiensis]